MTQTIQKDTLHNSTRRLCFPQLMLTRNEEIIEIPYPEASRNGVAEDLMRMFEGLERLMSKNPYAELIASHERST